MSMPNTDLVKGNIHVIYEPSIASQVHIATCRAIDGSFMAFLVMHGNLVKTIWNPNLLAGEARTTRSAALLSLLEGTEDRIRDMLLKNSDKHAEKKTHRSSTTNSTKASETSSISSKKERIIPMPGCETEQQVGVDYGEKPKDKGFLPWRKSIKSESIYTTG